MPVVSAHFRSLVVQNVTSFAVFISGCERHIVCCGQGLQLVLVVGLPYYSVSLCFDKIVCRPILFVSFNILMVSILISLTAYACIFYCINCCFRIVFVYCSVTNLAVGPPYGYKRPIKFTYFTYVQGRPKSEATDS